MPAKLREDARDRYANVRPIVAIAAIGLPRPESADFAFCVQSLDCYLERLAIAGTQRHPEPKWAECRPGRRAASASIHTSVPEAAGEAL